MARAIEMFLSLSLILTTIWACKDGQVDQLTARQGLDELLIENSYPTNPWMFPYYYNIHPRVPFAGYANSYEGRIPFNRKPPGYFANVNADYYNSQEGRLGFGNLGVNVFNTGLFSNLFTPVNTLANLLNRVEACTAPSGEVGVCSSTSACSSISGRPTGSCTLGRVCCVNVITTCGDTTTRNNTYWQSPSTVASSSCALTVRLDNKLAEQSTSICQIRLNFVSFTTAQPTAGTCMDSTFTVEGATTVAPTICGVNSGQHMFLDVPSSATTPTDVKLIFKFGTGTTTIPSWNIKIALLPCGASYLAPKDCLQYFSSATGRVRSFNWQDVAIGPIRQLNNQNYNICFRTELVSSQIATQMCVSTCQVTNGGDSFSITTPTSDAAQTAAGTAATDAAAAAAAVGTTNAATTASTAATSAAAAATAAATAGAVSGVGTNILVGNVNTASCMYDFLAISGGVDPVTGNVADRFCGNALNPAAGVTTSTPVCTSAKQFRMTYRTDGQETAVSVNVPTRPVVAPADTANTGFCLDFEEK